MLPGSRPRRLATISHQPPTLLTAELTLNAQSTPYVAPARTAYKTPLPTVLFFSSHSYRHGQCREHRFRVTPVLRVTKDVA
jgi:hypothetical protein